MNAHCNNYNIRTCCFARYFETFLQRRDGTVEVAVGGGEYTAKDTVQDDVSFLVGEPLEYRTSETSYAAGSLVSKRGAGAQFR